MMVTLDTHLRAENSLGIIRALGFIGRIISTAIRMTGGIWVMWNEPTVHATTLLFTLRLVHVLVDYNPALPPMNVTVIYNFPHYGMEN